MNYFHGGDIYRNDVKYDFSVNTNPLGMPEEGAEAAHRAIELSSCYPDPFCDALRSAIAENDGVKKESITAGNGTAQLIHLICLCLGVKKALAPAPCFCEYERAVNTAGGKMHYHILSEEDGFKPDEAFTDCIDRKTDIVFICSPNNPTGRLYERAYIEGLAKKCLENNAYLCIDECFLPFCEAEDRLSFKRDIYYYPNIIVLRAFTKIYSMAGLRLGYMLSNDDALTNKIREMMPLWSVSLPAQLAGTEVLKDKRYMSETLKLIRDERKYLSNELKGLAKKVYESSANFILFRADEGLYDYMIKNGILIRSCADFTGLGRGFFRIAVKKHYENEIFIESFRNYKEV